MSQEFILSEMQSVYDEAYDMLMGGNPDRERAIAIIEALHSKAQIALNAGYSGGPNQLLRRADELESHLATFD
jgi:hypothetical protein